jgi:hypothetical protein
MLHVARYMVFAKQSLATFRRPTIITLPRFPHLDPNWPPGVYIIDTQVEVSHNSQALSVSYPSGN